MKKGTLFLIKKVNEYWQVFLAIVLGGLGIHKFVLGYTKEGIMMLIGTFVLGVLTCGIAIWVVSVIGLIEGIIYLTKI